MSEIIKYFVEGECEKVIINTLKAPPLSLIKPGRVEVFNVIKDKITLPRITQLKKETNIILVYDTDINKTDVLDYNIDLLHQYGFNKIYHIQSVKKLEDELVRSSSIKRIEEMFDTQGMDEFKHKLISNANLVSKLKSIDFDINKMWRQRPYSSLFLTYYNKDFVNKILEKNNSKNH